MLMRAAIRDLGGRGPRVMVEAEKMKRRQSVLAGFGEFALRSDDLDAVLTQACRLVAQALDTSRVKVLEIREEEEESSSLLVRAGIGWSPGLSVACACKCPSIRRRPTRSRRACR